jgi:hypothetical protein
VNGQRDRTARRPTLQPALRRCQRYSCCGRVNPVELPVLNSQRQRKELQVNQQRLPRPRLGLLCFGFSALLAVSAATAQVAGAAPGATGIDASGSYRQEVQACASGRTQQDSETCLREARNARADRQQGSIATAPGTFDANAQARCDALGGEEKAACQARVAGYGSTSGSVAGGGVLRQVETVVVPPGQAEVTIQPKTDSAPVILVPIDRR